MGFKSTFIPEEVLRSTARLLVWAMELEVSTETRKQHAHATHRLSHEAHVPSTP